VIRQNNLSQALLHVHNVQRHNGEEVECGVTIALAKVVGSSLRYKKLSELRRGVEEERRTKARGGLYPQAAEAERLLTNGVVK
jgi:hypothetical protein